MSNSQLESASVNRNARAFLDMIAAAEGTTRYGYYTLVGGSRLSSLVKHPGKVVRLSSSLSSTAAGRYQFLKGTWDTLQRRLGLPDFGPHSQDIAALELIREKGALNKVLQGDVQGAINATRKVWASFPGAGYGQGERSMSYMLNAYNRAGGTGGTGGASSPNVASDDPIDRIVTDIWAPGYDAVAGPTQAGMIDSPLLLLVAAGIIAYVVISSR